MGHWGKLDNFKYHAKTCDGETPFASPKKMNDVNAEGNEGSFHSQLIFNLSTYHTRQVPTGGFQRRARPRTLA